MGFEGQSRLYIAAMLAVEYATTCALLAAYWILGRVDGRIVAAMVAYSLVVNAIGLHMTSTGQSKRLSASTATALQLVAACVRDFGGCLLVPDLWFIFVLNLVNVMPLASLQFSGRTLGRFCLGTCIGFGLIFVVFLDSPELHFDGRPERLLLWTVIAAALARLAMFGSHVASLRQESLSRVVAQDEASRRLEREQISRELHDSLLQAAYGLVWRFAGLSRELPPDDPVRRKLDTALDRAEDTLKVIRDEVFGLRSASPQQMSLAEGLRHAGERLASDCGMSFIMLSHGAEMSLTETVRANFANILHEAMLNAFRHSAGCSVRLELHFSPRELRASVTDDGLGIEEDAERTCRDGHFGLAVMRERAANVGAKITIGRTTAGGTLVEIRVSAALAYATRSREEAGASSALGSGELKPSTRAIHPHPWFPDISSRAR
ncbi:sensor histidine kinase [Variovorax sp. Sphag1AA]|uniref:sensor histidine kinase n=1 Tax=Variovorax sp. Sphag1AA TaxID=2587027 RepID=UPI00161DBD4B|nr:ATP-binding protein [Variovorax sp. Sphag1AA]MBB3178763.1 signal transduction histidine kinase [Variovorax sp. Sphag1AA]